MPNYLERDADLIRSCLPEGVDVPSGSEDLFLAYAVLMRAKGVRTTAEDVHDAWTAWISRSDPRHASAIPFNELDVETKAADQPFLIAIQRAAHSMEGRVR